jgi:hypothetical protein
VQVTSLAPVQTKQRSSSRPQDGRYRKVTIITIDHALFRPWTVTRKYQRDPNQELVCAENNEHLQPKAKVTFDGGRDSTAPAATFNRDFNQRARLVGHKN